MTDKLIVLGEPLTLGKLAHIAAGGATCVVSAAGMEAVRKGYAYLQNRLANGDEAIYGINTGFGSLCDVRISHTQLAELQLNLVRSHACGTGYEIPASQVRLMLALKLQSLLFGYSGIAPETVELLLGMLNADCLPIIYAQGSLGASGDLAPLAHLSLPLFGDGECRLNGIRLSGEEALQQAGLRPVQLQAKEGLAMLNGTQFMSALGTHSLVAAWNAMHWASIINALSNEAFLGRIEPFHPLLHRARNHSGQAQIAQLHLSIVTGSEMASTARPAVQDPYSFRCVPQVHGAALQVLQHATEVLLNEANAVTDNPNIFPDDDLILSGGNFHGQAIAAAMDYLALGVHTLGNISERRTYQLISGQRSLPHFLAHNPGLESGLMIPQYAAASIVSRTKLLCSPASADSIVSSNGQEDLVSMGAHSAIKLVEVVESVERVLAIELLTATQAMHFRSEATSPLLVELLVAARQIVDPGARDRIMAPEMDGLKDYIRSTPATELLQRYAITPLQGAQMH